jgi:hypothetical protein
VKNHDFTPKNHIFSNCGGRCEHFWGISCEKSRFYANKSYFFQLRREQKIIFFPILGGACAGCASPWIRPWSLYCLIFDLRLQIEYHFGIFKYFHFLKYLRKHIYSLCSKEIYHVPHMTKCDIWSILLGSTGVYIYDLNSVLCCRGSTFRKCCLLKNILCRPNKINNWFRQCKLRLDLICDIHVSLIYVSVHIKVFVDP